MHNTSMNTALDFEGFAREVFSPSAAPELSWRPMFIGLKPGDYEDFRTFCRQHHIFLIDAIDRQLMDLASARIPSTHRRAEREGFIEEIIAARGGRASYGTWVYEARYAAGQVGHVVRRLLLGERIPPYCGNLDLSDLVPSRRQVQ